MNDKNVRVWIWIQDDILHKAVYNPSDKIFTVYNERDEIIFRRIGLPPDKLSSLETFFLHLGAKRIDRQKEPFTYL